MKDESFREYVIDQLSDVPHLRTRKMFGGLGIYSDDVFFALVTSGDVLYFKTSEKTSRQYISAGSDFFKPSPEQHLKNYYEVPPEVLEDREVLIEWAREAIEIAS